jgi:hypothetical protein
MKPFQGYIIAVAVVMVAVVALIWFLRGPAQAKLVVIFFIGWVVGATSMYIKALLVYKP